MFVVCYRLKERNKLQHTRPRRSCGQHCSMNFVANTNTQHKLGIATTLWLAHFVLAPWGIHQLSSKSVAAWNLMKLFHQFWMGNNHNKMENPASKASDHQASRCASERFAEKRLSKHKRINDYFSILKQKSAHLSKRPAADSCLSELCTNKLWQQ